MTPYLAVPGGEDCTEDFTVLLHLLVLPLEAALHVGVGQHVLHHVLLQGAPQRPLVGAVKPEPGLTGQDKSGVKPPMLNTRPETSKESVLRDLLYRRT